MQRNKTYEVESRENSVSRHWMLKLAEQHGERATVNMLENLQEGINMLKVKVAQSCLPLCDPIDYGANIFPFLPPLQQPPFYSDSICLALLDSMCEIMQYVSFYVCLISLMITSSKSIHVITTDNVSSFFMAE